MPFSYNGVYQQPSQICPQDVKKMLLSISIGTFLTNYDVTNRKLERSYYTPLYENQQFESRIIQWRLLVLLPWNGCSVEVKTALAYIETFSIKSCQKRKSIGGVFAQQLRNVYFPRFSGNFRNLSF